jgi:hypothetical protein
MARPQDADQEGSFQPWRVATIKLNKRLWTANKGWASYLGVGRGANLLQKFTMSLEFERISKHTTKMNKHLEKLISI